ncbi:response regulator [Paracidovorax citrulli]|nr:response regulator [Paracidovorax citrulli]ATG93197.1 response regulator [Paracidovorax citrulli]MVT28595.1 response regulator [Paracidovorax citrulli]PVY67033.1 response regulator receiver domain-containing protein [Paracidovorax citrulli]QCX12881.1 Transcriptional regulatory protein YycF [Paracidovorax citrulli]REG68804.1 response regulator receiver domain-containing protein [Paracidovorax citrulli]
MKTVLIVDDHAEIRRLLRMTLEDQGVALHEAASGEAALAMARAQRPDLVLLDLMMPGSLDGMEVCRRIRNDPDLSHTRVIILSARDGLQDRAAGMQAGASGFISKPFSPAYLAETVRRLDTAGTPVAG